MVKEKNETLVHNTFFKHLIFYQITHGPFAKPLLQESTSHSWNFSTHTDAVAISTEDKETLVLCNQHILVSRWLPHVTAPRLYSETWNSFLTRTRLVSLSLPLNSSPEKCFPKTKIQKTKPTLKSKGKCPSVFHKHIF